MKSLFVAVLVLLSSPLLSHAATTCAGMCKFCSLPRTITGEANIKKFKAEFPAMFKEIADEVTAYNLVHATGKISTVTRIDYDGTPDSCRARLRVNGIHPHEFSAIHVADFMADPTPDLGVQDCFKKLGLTLNPQRTQLVWKP